MRHRILEPRFVQQIPRELEEGVLYVSMQYGTVVHSCCCGCGLDIVTPLTPTDWQLTFDGETISLWPSVGNWNLPCKSHYVIRRNRVIEAGHWSQERIEKEQRRAKVAKAEFCSSHEPEASVGPPKMRQANIEETAGQGRILVRPVQTPIAYGI